MALVGRGMAGSTECIEWVCAGAVLLDRVGAHFPRPRRDTSPARGLFLRARRALPI